MFITAKENTMFEDLFEQPQPKFSVGDTVVITGPIRTGGAKLGHVGKITGINPEGYLYKDYHGITYYIDKWWYGEDALKLKTEDNVRQFLLTVNYDTNEVSIELVDKN